MNSAGIFEMLLLCCRTKRNDQSSVTGRPAFLSSEAQCGHSTFLLRKAFCSIRPYFLFVMISTEFQMPNGFHIGICRLSVTACLSSHRRRSVTGVTIWVSAVAAIFACFLTLSLIG